MTAFAKSRGGNRPALPLTRPLWRGRHAATGQLTASAGELKTQMLRAFAFIEPCLPLFVFDLLEINGQDLRREPIEIRKRELAKLLRNARLGLQLNEHVDDLPGDVVFRHACKLGLEGIVSKRLGSHYRSGRSPDWLKMKNPAAPAVKREAEEDWGRERWR
jgi:ATP dependent DNA ligase-like protein